MYSTASQLRITHCPFLFIVTYRSISRACCAGEVQAVRHGENTDGAGLDPAGPPWCDHAW